MAKKTREEKRAEETRIIAEMDAAMGKISTPSATADEINQEGMSVPNVEKIHCKRCKTLMEKGVCPVCGFRIYTPIAEDKRKKIRIIVAAACLALFAVLFVIYRVL